MRWLSFVWGAVPTRRLAALSLIPIAWLVVMIGAGTLGSTGLAVEEGDGELMCGERLVVEPADGAAFSGASTRVVLALDQVWHAEYAERADEVARALLVEVSALFRGIHIHLLPTRVAAWTSPETTSAEALHEAARATIDLGRADIVVALTGRTLSPKDGFGPIGGRYAVVGHHPEQPERDALVLAHEVAHLFGASHGCDLDDHEGVMAGRGFDEPALICPCTRTVLEANAMRFHTR